MLVSNVKKIISIFRTVLVLSFLITGCFSDGYMGNEPMETDNEISIRKNETDSRQVKFFISGRLTSPGGLPKAGIKVKAYPMKGSNIDYSKRPYVITTDQNGDFRINNVKDGRYTIKPVNANNFFIPELRKIYTAGYTNPRGYDDADFLVLTNEIANFPSYPQVVLPPGYKKDLDIFVSTLKFQTRMYKHYIPISKAYRIKYDNEFYTNFNPNEVADITFKYDNQELKDHGLVEEFSIFYYHKIDRDWKPIENISVDYDNSTVTAHLNHLAPVVLTATPPNRMVASPPECIYHDFGTIYGTGDKKYAIIDEYSKIYIDANYYILPFSESSENQRTFEDLGFSQSLAIATTNTGENPYLNRLSTAFNYILFEAPTNIEVYVLYNSPNIAPWMQDKGFTQVKDSFGRNYTIEASNHRSVYNVYKRNFTAGNMVLLNGNKYGLSGEGAFFNYWVIIKPTGNLSCDANTNFPQAKVQNLKAIPGVNQHGELCVTLMWENPDKLETNNIYIERSEDGPPMAGGGTPVIRGTNSESFRDISSKLKSNGTYFYTVFTVGEDGYEAGTSIEVEMAPDFDMDGLSDDYENEIGSDPFNADSDGDGLIDGDEVAGGTDPNNNDTIKPVITLIGSSVVTIQNGDSYSDTGATAYDNNDGDITNQIEINDSVISDKVGTYTITYNVSDSAGNKAEQVTRIVNVVDTVAPVIILNGPSVVEIELESTYVDEGAKAFDNTEGDISSRIVVTNPVNTQEVGIYLVKYDVSDLSGNQATTAIRTVKVLDKTPPFIVLQGDNPTSVEHGTPYLDKGALAFDKIDGNITSKIITNNPVDTNQVGSYIVTYNVVDSAGNAAKEVTRTVNVVDVTAPVITRKGSAVVEIEINSTYVDEGASALDAVDGDLTQNIITTSNVDTSEVGIYLVTYNVKDSAGNAATQVFRTVKVVDSQPPVIILNGPAVVEIGLESTYIDEGAKAIDNVDGDISSQIVISNTVNTQELGIYKVIYNVTDSSGNKAAEVIRTVNVVDKTPPFIVLMGENPTKVEQGTVYEDAGAIAYDKIDGNISSKIIVSNTVNTSQIGSYIVTYNVVDAAGNAANQTVRTVNVVDTTPPEIVLNGSNTVEIEVGSTYDDEGALAYDNVDGDLTANIITNNNVDTAATGIYSVIYNVTDSSGNNAVQKVRVVKVVDTTAPVIVLNGNSHVTAGFGQPYTDQGAKAFDNYDGNISSAIVVENKVNTDMIGVYEVIYNVKDSSGNEATQVVRTVIVVDTQPPMISLKGPATVQVEVNTVYVDEGAIAFDNTDGNITQNLIIDNQVDTNLVGTYKVTYNIKDLAGNQAQEKTRTVEVVDTTAPIITLNGNANVTIECGTTYTDEGATALDNYEGNISYKITTNNTVDITKVGLYAVIYNAKDFAGNKAVQVVRNVNVVDTQAPIIILNGSAEIEIAKDSTYVDEGANAIDIVDGNLSQQIITTNPVNTAIVGDYTVTYDVTDSAGNKAQQKTRLVKVRFIDTVAPVINILGDNPATVGYGTTYVDAGAIAIDNVDGNISSNMNIYNQVNTNELGTYVVIYNVADSAGNLAEQKTRIVNVVDATAPVITLLGDSNVTIELGSTYIDAGATALDNYEGNVSARIITNNNVDVDEIGYYIVTYNVSDSAGNQATQIVRHVHVVDTQAPIIILNGPAVVSVNKNDIYVDEGAKAFDNAEGDISSEIITINPVDTTVAGNYTVTYNVTDSSGNQAQQLTRLVKVIETDMIPPVITLLGDNPFTVNQGSTYVEPGAIAIDNIDGDISENIIVYGQVNTNIIGTYILTYVVSDAAGNLSLQKKRTVEVVSLADIQPPVITLNGADLIKIPVGIAYSDPGATAIDNVDGDISGNIIVTNPVNINVIGTYTVTYNVSDSSGNQASQKTRIVMIIRGRVWYGDFTVTSSSTLSQIEGYSRITGDLNILDTNLSSIEKLSSLTEVEGNLKIWGNHNLQDLFGLENLVSVGKFLKIRYNSNIRDISSLSNLSHLGGRLVIGETNLQDFTDLRYSNLTSIGGRLNIYSNPSLTSLNGLQNIKNIGDVLIIENNPNLESIYALFGLSSVEGDYIKIKNNSKIADNYAHYFINTLSNSGAFSGYSIVE